MRPSTTRGEFCAATGLDASRPILLYVCSSHFIAPHEVAFVRQEPWEGADLGVDNAVVWSASKVQADPTLYDSLHHAAAVVGLNTSAMIEAGILGKSVYTIETKEFAGGQEQTLHFHYLLTRNGGLVEVAKNLDEHLAQLSHALANPEAGATRSRSFVESFVRPRGIDRAVAPIVADEIEGLSALRKRRRRTPLWHYPARRALLAALRRRSG